MAETFTRKIIEVSIELVNNPQTNQPNTFSGTGSDTATIKDKRISCRIQNSGAPSNSTALVSIYGLSESIVNQLSTLGLRINLVPGNVLSIKAGDDVVGLTTVFRGTIRQAYIDAAAAPDVPFILDCQAGFAAATANVQPTSYRGSVPVSTIMSGFARIMNLGFENNGVDGTITNPYYRGSIDAQRKQCARDANINAEIDPGKNVLAIWPKFGSRTTSKIPLIAPPPEGAMIGYPSFTQQGIMLRNVFNPDIAAGAKVQVKTNLKPLQKANGVWTVSRLDLALDSQVPKGQWSETMYCYNQAIGSPVIAPPR